MQLITKADLKLLSHRQQVQFALFCAKQVEAKWKDKPACVAAIATAEAWLEGKATAEECRKAADAAAYAATYAANAAYVAAYAAYAANVAKAAADAAAKAVYAAYVVYVAAYAAYAAAYAAEAAANAAAKEKTIAEQWNYFYTLLGELGKVLYF